MSQHASVLLVPLTQLQQPALSVWVEEGVCEVVPVVFWDFERFVLDAVIQVLCGGRGKQGEGEEDKRKSRDVGSLESRAKERRMLRESGGLRGRVIG